MAKNCINSSNAKLRRNISDIGSTENISPFATIPFGYIFGILRVTGLPMVWRKKVAINQRALQIKNTNAT